MKPRNLYFALLLIVSSYLGHTVSILTYSCPKIDVCFTPGQDCTTQIVDTIDNATLSILIQAYGFTSQPIVESLIRAKKRGVDIQVILDKTQIKSRYSVVKELLNEGIPILIDYKPAIAHSKVIIIDNQKVITGSFNFTTAAQKRNAENLLIINNHPTLVEKYVENWNKRKEQSESFTTEQL